MASITVDPVADDPIDPADDLLINDPPPSTDPAPAGDLTCEQCGKSFNHFGRGRKPKRCEECRASKPTASTGNRPRSSGKNVDTLIAQIEATYMQIGMVMSFVPTTAQDGAVVAGGAHKMAESWRPLLETNPKVRRMWEKMLAGSGWSGVIMAHAVVVYPILQNHNMAPKPRLRSVPNE